MALPTHDAGGRVTTPFAAIALRFAADVAPFIVENQQRHDSQTSRRQPDGTVAFTVELPTDPAVLFQFRRWVLSWGRGVEVVEPAWLRAEIASELRASAAAYAGEPEGFDVVLEAFAPDS